MVTAVALADADAPSGRWRAADARVQLLVGDVLGFGGIVAFPDDRRLVAALGGWRSMQFYRHVGRAVLEPFDRDVVRIVAGVLHLGERLDPVDALAVLGPEATDRPPNACTFLVLASSTKARALASAGRDKLSRT